MMEEKRGASRLGPAPAGAGRGAEPSLPQPPRPQPENAAPTAPWDTLWALLEDRPPSEQKMRRKKGLSSLS